VDTRTKWKINQNVVGMYIIVGAEKIFFKKKKNSVTGSSAHELQKILEQTYSCGLTIDCQRNRQKQKLTSLSVRHSSQGLRGSSCGSLIITYRKWRAMKSTHQRVGSSQDSFKQVAGIGCASLSQGWVNQWMVGETLLSWTSSWWNIGIQVRL